MFYVQADLLCFVRVLYIFARERAPLPSISEASVLIKGHLALTHLCILAGSVAQD